jgi:hypothetical protein
MPFSWCSLRSEKVRSLQNHQVADGARGEDLPVSARLMMRVARWTASPATSSELRSTPPVCRPVRTPRPMPRASAITYSPQRIRSLASDLSLTMDDLDAAEGFESRGGEAHQVR